MDNGASSYRRFLDGDDKGLEELVRDHKDGLILYLNGFVNNIFTAEELMEETFFKLITKRPRFSAKYSFKTWLYTIGRNVAIDHIRRNSKIAAVSIEDVESFISDEYDLEKSYTYIKVSKIGVPYDCLYQLNDPAVSELNGVKVTVGGIYKNDDSKDFELVFADFSHEGLQYRVTVENVPFGKDLSSWLPGIIVELTK